MAGTCQKYSFFNFATCEPLNYDEFNVVEKEFGDEEILLDANLFNWYTRYVYVAPKIN